MIKIENFVDDMNYTSIIIHVDDSVDLNSLKSKLEKDQLNHMSSWDAISEDRLFFIENCDLQVIGYNELREFVENGYGILNLKQDSKGEYYLKTGHDGLVS